MGHTRWMWGLAGTDLASGGVFLALLLRPDAGMVPEIMAITAVGAVVQAITGFRFSLV